MKYKVIQDTLMKKNQDGTYRYSTTYLSMFSSLMLAYGMSIYHFLTNGFDFKVFLMLLLTGMSHKVVNAIAEKLTL